MNDIEKKLAKVLADAEAGVLEVIAVAAASGDYATIDRARAIAESLKDINRNVNAGPRAADSSPPVYKRTQRKKRKATPKKGGYPRFYVEDASLFKVGWSKKKGGEYVHRVPLGTVKNIAEAIEQFSASPGPVSSDQILTPEFLKEAGNPPSYQVYIVLAFLKEREIIASTGREGFRFPPNIASLS